MGNAGFISSTVGSMLFPSLKPRSSDVPEQRTSRPPTWRVGGRSKLVRSRLTSTLKGVSIGVMILIDLYVYNRTSY